MCDQSDKFFPHYNSPWVPEEETEGSFLTIFQDLKLIHLQSFTNNIYSSKKLTVSLICSSIRIPLYFVYTSKTDGQNLIF